MTHPVELIERIKSIIERDYPPTLYRYQFERAIPGSRMMPDILVYDQTNKMLCAVEIGYTRPEKLSAYRDHYKIPDVRWYDKQGRLHADVKEVSVALTVSTEPAGMLYAYGLEDTLPCDDCFMEWHEVEEERRSDPGAEIFEEDFTERFLEDSFHYVSTILVTDYTKAWFACFCDKCGGSWFDSDSERANMICSELDDAREFGRTYGGRSAPMEWRECVELVEQRFDLELRYEDGVFVDPVHNREWNSSLLRIRQNLAGEQLGQAPIRVLRPSQRDDAAPAVNQDEARADQ